MPDLKLQYETGKSEDLEISCERQTGISTKRVLCVGADISTAEFVRAMAGNNPIEIIQIKNAEEARALLRNDSFDIVACSYALSGMNGIEFLKHAGALYPETITILNVYGCSTEVMGQAYRKGICYFIDQAPLNASGSLTTRENLNVPI